MGIPALLLIPALFNSSRRNLSVVAPFAVLMLIADTFQLQPNPYDNNKLIYPAFVLMIGAVADYMVVIYDKLKGVGGRRILATGTIIACVLSGALSMGREYVADEYEMYNATQIEAAWWVEENTEKDAVILTNDRYNNAVSSLTGRDLVCGGQWFISMHGLPGYQERQKDIRLMYSDPQNNMELFDKYSVDYIMVGPDEKNSYTVNEADIKAMAESVFEKNDVVIYQINN